jgi:hypothetical protein
MAKNLVIFEKAFIICSGAIEEYCHRGGRDEKSIF